MRKVERVYLSGEGVIYKMLMFKYIIPIGWTLIKMKKVYSTFVNHSNDQAQSPPSSFILATPP